MKVLLFILSLGAGAAFADPACVSHIPCGTYEGTGAWYDLNGHKVSKSDFLEKTVVSPLDETSVAVDEYVYKAGEKIEDGYVLKVKFTFEPDGRYTATLREDGQAFANGACVAKVCTFAFMPWERKGIVTGNVNVLRFENGKLRRLLMVSQGMNDDAAGIQKSELALVKGE